MIQLPLDLTHFLAEDRQLIYPAAECECGQVTLLPIGRHTLGDVWIDGQSLYDIATDPNDGIEGYYVVPAVNLIASCEGYDPEHILSWIPELNMYCSWDCDHWAITAFPGTTWDTISAEPLRYINAQWYPSHTGEPFVPWPHFPFKPGRPF